MLIQIAGDIGPFLDSVQNRQVPVAVVAFCKVADMGTGRSPGDIEQTVRREMLRAIHSVVAPKMARGELSFRDLGTGNTRHVLPEVHAASGLAHAGIAVDMQAMSFGIDGHPPYPPPQAPAQQGGVSMGGNPNAAHPAIPGMPGIPGFGGAGAGGVPGMPLTRGKLVLMLVGGLGLGILGIGGNMLKRGAKEAMVGSGGKDSAGYLPLGIDPKAADADKLIPSVQSLAARWKSDAAFWSVSARGVRSDGTMDLTTEDASATVEFISVSGVQSYAKSVREGTVKEFSFGSTGVDYSRAKTPLDRWTLTSTPSLPHCTIKQLAASLASKGLTGKKMVRVSFDPQEDSLMKFPEQAWRVMGDDPKIDSYFSMATCKQLK
jgi:hypothetical protein